MLSNFSGFGQNSNDTLNVKPNSIIFYSITQSEFDSIIQEDTGNDLTEVISDFELYVSRVLNVLEKDTTKHTTYTTHRFYNIINQNGSVIFDRIDRDTTVGMLLNGTNKYEVIQGVGTDIDMLETINEFFKTP